MEYIAAEIAGAVAYLHSAASPRIIHQNIKSTNILLDENFVAKVADYGASKTVPRDHAEIATLVQGTFGYIVLVCFTGAPSASVF